MVYKLKYWYIGEEPLKKIVLVDRKKCGSNTVKIVPKFDRSLLKHFLIYIIIIIYLLFVHEIVFGNFGVKSIYFG